MVMFSYGDVFLRHTIVCLTDKNDSQIINGICFHLPSYLSIEHQMTEISICDCFFLLFKNDVDSVRMMENLHT